MRTIKHQFFLSVVAAFALSCSSVSNRKLDEWVAVAIVDGTNTANQDKVRSTLKKSNIECFMEGSRVYAVMVPEKKLDQARRALLENPELKLIILEDGKIPESSFPKKMRRPN